MDDIEISGHTDQIIFAGDEDNLLVVGRPCGGLDTAVYTADDLDLCMSALRQLCRADVQERVNRLGRGVRAWQCLRRRGGRRGSVRLRGSGGRASRLHTLAWRKARVRGRRRMRRAACVSGGGSGGGGGLTWTLPPITCRISTWTPWGEGDSAATKTAPVSGSSAMAAGGREGGSPATARRRGERLLMAVDVDVRFKIFIIPPRVYLFPISLFHTPHCNARHHRQGSPTSSQGIRRLRSQDRRRACQMERQDHQRTPRRHTRKAQAAGCQGREHCRQDRRRQLRASSCLQEVSLVQDGYA